MKKEKAKNSSKPRFRDLLLEVIGELAVYAIFFIVGIGVLCLLGSTDALQNWDPESVVLVGCCALAVLVLVVCCIIKFIKKKKK